MESRLELRASNDGLRRFHNHNHGTSDFFWLKEPSSAFTFKTLLRHCAKLALTPWSLNMKLGLQLKGESGSSHFQPGKGHSSGLLRDYEPSDGPF